MPIKEEHIDHHVIYGDWDDFNDDQFLVHYHPNGTDCTVFIMGGCDYGGGVSYWFNCKSAQVDSLVSQKGKSSSGIKAEVEELPEAISKRNIRGIYT